MLLNEWMVRSLTRLPRMARYLSQEICINNGERVRKMKRESEAWLRLKLTRIPNDLFIKRKYEKAPYYRFYGMWRLWLLSNAAIMMFRH